MWRNGLCDRVMTLRQATVLNKNLGLFLYSSMSDCTARASYYQSADLHVFRLSCHFGRRCVYAV